MKKDITELFTYVDDFCTQYEHHIKAQQITNKVNRKPTRIPCISKSEIMTIIILFQQSPCTNFKYFYKSYLTLYKAEFPTLPSYNRFIELQQRTLSYFYAFIMIVCKIQKQTGIAFIDSTRIPVCHNKRTSRHKVFKGLAKLGKSTMGWFFGFKLHLVITEKGDLLAIDLTPGNTDDRKPVRKMVSSLTGLLFGDKGYIDQKLFHDLHQEGLKLITGIKKKMKNKLMTIKEKTLLRKRSIIETVNGVLKEGFNMVHTRHRSPINGFIHIFSTLIAYTLKTKKPAIKWKDLIPN